jgi:hypothetical protein
MPWKLTVVNNERNDIRGGIESCTELIQQRLDRIKTLALFAMCALFLFIWGIAKDQVFWWAVGLPVLTYTNLKAWICLVDIGSLKKTRNQLHWALMFAERQHQAEEHEREWFRRGRER